MAKGKELIVLHDAVSYTHPDHQGEGRRNLPPGVPAAITVANRGQRIPIGEADDDNLDALPHIDPREAKRLVHLGAAADNEDALDAKLALAGQRSDTRLGAPYASLTSSVEQQRAAVAVAQMVGGSGPQTKKSDLARLQIGDLQRLALAFGAPEDVYGSGEKDTILDFLAGDDDNAEDPADAAKKEQLRDEAQVGAREFAGTEGGKVGTNVTGDARRADTGLRTERATDSVEEAPAQATPRRSSRKQQTDDS